MDGAQGRTKGRRFLCLAVAAVIAGCSTIRVEMAGGRDAAPDAGASDGGSTPSPTDGRPADGPCAALSCGAGTHCAVAPSCTTPPCYECVPQDICTEILCPSAQRCGVQAILCEPACLTAVCQASNERCGGLAGTDCPGAGTCIDVPGDTCDPERGGANCWGTCECAPEAPCPVGSVWNASRHVCACVPESSTTCGSTICRAGQICCDPTCGICAPEKLCKFIDCR